MRKMYQEEESRENGKSVSEKTQMKELRSGMSNKDSDDSIRRSGGEDPRRYEAKIMIDRTVTNHDQSGYNHNGIIIPEAATGNNEYKSMMDKRAMSMGMPNSDGTYEK